MTRAHRKGAALRRKLGLTGRVDAEALANIMGYPVIRLALQVQMEVEVDGTSASPSGWGRRRAIGASPTPWGTR